MEFLKLIWIALIAFFIGYLVWKLVKYSELQKVKKESIKKSRSAILWETAEKVAPFLPNFPYNPKDLTFIWKWVDYIVFDWLSNWNSKQIVFLEVKTWKSKQNKNEKETEKIILQKKVKYELRKMDL